MNNKKLHLQTLAIAVMIAASSMASAAPVPPQGPGAVVLTNTAANIWTASIGNTPDVGAFTDIFTFTPNATLGSYAWTAVSNLSFTMDDKVTFVSATLNSTPLFVGALPVPFGGTYSFAGLLPTPVAGPLTLTINGVSTGGAYGGNFTVAMAPVPEPETYGMMIAGLGILAMLARRRKQ